MNLIDKMTQRIESNRTTNKNPCKNYATKEAAEKATAKMAARVAEHHEVQDAEYVVFYVETWGRWVGAVNVSKATRDGCGGWLGLAAENGFYSY